MGAEVTGRAEWNGRAASGRVQLETAALIFRGDGLRLTLPFGEITAIAADDGWLHVEATTGRGAFEVGRAAARWASRIANPPTRIDKMGFAPGQRVAIVDVADPTFGDEVAARIGVPFVPQVADDLDILAVQIDEPGGLTRLADLRSRLRPTGTIWVISPKGRRDLRDVEIIAASKAAGLVDVKISVFSATHTATKLVIPIALRQESDTSRPQSRN